MHLLQDHHHHHHTSGGTILDLATAVLIDIRLLQRVLVRHQDTTLLRDMIARSLSLLLQVHLHGQILVSRLRAIIRPHLSMTIIHPRDTGLIHTITMI